MSDDLTHEEWRYATVQEQMKALLDAAATDLNPATNLARAMLYAELWARNEQTHQRVLAEKEHDEETT